MTQVNYWPCKKCGKELNDCQQRGQPRLYCDDCRRESEALRNKIRKFHKHVCIRCGKSFLSRRRNTQYCSQRCNMHALRNVRVKKNCVICNNNMIPFGKRKYCSNKCKLIGFYKMRLKSLGVIV